MKQLPHATGSDPVVVFDVGANVGFFTAHCAAMVRSRDHKNVTVYAFEPVPATFHTLATNVASNRLHQGPTVRMGLMQNRLPEHVCDTVLCATGSLAAPWALQERHSSNHGILSGNARQLHDATV